MKEKEKKKKLNTNANKNIRLFPNFREIKHLFLTFYIKREEKKAYLISEGTANFAT